ncbi:MAG: hypothetical protein ABS939_00050 [Psychrobacillus sp.]
MSKEYREIAEKLQALFPPGTLQLTGKQKAHIPVQAYMKRLEEVAGEAWSWHIVGTPTYQPELKAVTVIGELTILQATRSGLGFSHYVPTSDIKSVSGYKNAVNSAESDAIRNACDKFLMGWQDLAPFRDWGSNPGVFPQMEQSPPNQIKSESTPVCTKCSQPLKMEDILFLELHRVNIPFCLEHVPNHFKKKKD